MLLFPYLFCFFLSFFSLLFVYFNTWHILLSRKNVCKYVSMMMIQSDQVNTYIVRFGSYILLVVTPRVFCTHYMYHMYHNICVYNVASRSLYFVVSIDVVRNASVIYMIKIQGRTSESLNSGSKTRYYSFKHA